MRFVESCECVWQTISVIEFLDLNSANFEYNEFMLMFFIPIILYSLYIVFREKHEILSEGALCYRIHENMKYKIEIPYHLLIFL